MLSGFSGKYHFEKGIPRGALQVLSHLPCLEGKGLDFYCCFSTQQQALRCQINDNSTLYVTVPALKGQIRYDRVSLLSHQALGVKPSVSASDWKPNQSRGVLALGTFQEGPKSPRDLLVPLLSSILFCECLFPLSPLSGFIHCDQN